MVNQTQRVKQTAALLLTILIAWSGCLCAGSVPRFSEGFGYARWGTNRDEVKSILELSHRVERAYAAWDSGEYTEYTYIDTSAELEYRVFPEFVHDSLYGTMLKFKVDGRSESDVTYAFRQLEVVLVNGNSLPVKVSSQTEPIGKGIAHAWFSVWDKAETEIDLFLVKYDEAEFDLGISYVCKDLEKLYDPMRVRDNDILLPKTASDLGVTELALTRAYWLLKLDGRSIDGEWSPFTAVQIPKREYFPKVDDFAPVEEMPVEIEHHDPVYPKMAEPWGEAAVVWIQALVDGDGKVRDARILKSSGIALGFDEAALEAAYKNVYRPAIQNGIPVPAWVAYKARFKARKQ